MKVLSKRKVPTTTPDWRAGVRRRTRFYVLMAVLLAVLFGILAFEFFSDRDHVDPRDLTSAVFAVDDIEAGTILTLDLVDQREVFKQAVPETHFVSAGQIIGQRPLYPLVSGEVILPGKLMSDQGGYLAQRCPTGKWCISFPVAWLIAPPPELIEGDRVEIAAVHSGQSQEQAGYIATSVQVVEFLKCGESEIFILAVDDQEALSILYSRANDYQLMILLQPAEG